MKAAVIAKMVPKGEGVSLTKINNRLVALDLEPVTKDNSIEDLFGRFEEGFSFGANNVHDKY